VGKNASVLGRKPPVYGVRIDDRAQISGVALTVGRQSLQSDGKVSSDSYLSRIDKCVSEG